MGGAAGRDAAERMVMREWKTVVRKMAGLTRGQLLGEWPLAGNDIAPPRQSEWPPSLPVCEAFLRFYALCDGGYFGNSAYRLFSLSEVAGRTGEWIDGLRDYDQRGDVLIPGRHVVFGEDSAGAPLVWDSHSGQVATFWFKGGDWEPIANSPEAFLERLFNPDPGRDAEWAEAIEQVLRS